jgi:adenine phosphoribosyltransferase
VLVVDDVLATGGTARAACELIEAVGGTVVGCAFVLELRALTGEKQLDRTPIQVLVPLGS